MKSIMLDTNAYSAYRRGNEDVLEALARAREGVHVGVRDVWIAAHCLQLGATMVTLDGHFSSVPGLRVWPPAA